MMNLPNWLTLARILSIPVLVAVFYGLPAPWSHIVSAWLFAAAAFTDWLDGWLARRMGLTTPLGAFLDPVADKLIVAVALILILQDHPTPWLAVPAAVIVGREIAISALREWMAELGKRAQVAVSMVGKVKTSAQLLALLLLLYREPVFSLQTGDIGLVLLYIAALLTLWSMAIYLKAAWPALMGAKPAGRSGEQG